MQPLLKDPDAYHHSQRVCHSPCTLLSEQPTRSTSHQMLQSHLYSYFVGVIQQVYGVKSKIVKILLNTILYSIPLLFSYCTLPSGHCCSVDGCDLHSAGEHIRMFLVSTRSLSWVAGE